MTALALDTAVDPKWMDENLPKGLPVQGHLDPAVLRTGSAVLKAEVDRLVDAWSDRPHIFNLGHGITPDVPVAHVEQLIRSVRDR